MKETGIYYILNKLNGKCYIGSSSDDFGKRWSVHRHQLNKNKHSNLHLQNSWNKHGAANFEFAVLEIVEPKLCIKREQFYIDSIKPEFNILQKAGSPLGFIHSQESRNKRSVSLKGHSVSDETRKRLSYQAKQRLSNPKNHPLFGKKHAESTKSTIKYKRKLQNMSSHFKPIQQIDLITGSAIKTWDSIKSAELALNLSRGNISKVCNKKSNLKSVGGFGWRFSNELTIL